jgi:hypothetical protein
MSALRKCSTYTQWYIGHENKWNPEIRDTVYGTKDHNLKWNNPGTEDK